jgi:hypothetical protein
VDLELQITELRRKFDKLQESKQEDALRIDDLEVIVIAFLKNKQTNKYSLKLLFNRNNFKLTII